MIGRHFPSTLIEVTRLGWISCDEIFVLTVVIANRGMGRQYYNIGCQWRGIKHWHGRRQVLDEGDARFKRLWVFGSIGGNMSFLHES